MRIAVVSPHTRCNGNTTLSMLIALELSSGDVKTCVTHSRPTSNSFYSYLNFSGYEDKTSTPSQIVKILKEGGLQADDISDYCKRVTDALEAFTNDTTNFDQDDMNYMINYMIKSFPHEHVIFDIDDNDLEQSRKIIAMCDVVVLNISQSITELKEFKDNKNSYMSLFEGKPLVVVVNKYDSIKGTIKETAHWMGIKQPNNWLVLRDNSWIAWATNHGQLDMLHRKMGSKDARVLEIKSDVSKICASLSKAKVYSDKKGSGGGLIGKKGGKK